MNHFHVLWSMTAILACVVSSSLGEMASYRSTSSLEDAAEVYARVADADELRILSSARMRRSIITEARKSFVRWVRQTYCDLQRAITQPILRLFLHICTISLFLRRALYLAP